MREIITNWGNLFLVVLIFTDCKGIPVIMKLYYHAISTKIPLQKSNRKQVIGRVCELVCAAPSFKKLIHWHSGANTSTVTLIPISETGLLPAFLAEVCGESSH